MKREANNSKIIKGKEKDIPTQYNQLLSNTYYQAVAFYEDSLNQLPFLDFNFNIIQVRATQQHILAITKDTVRLLSSGFNEGGYILVRSVRVLHYPTFTIMLAYDQGGNLQLIDRFLVLVVLYSNDQNRSSKFKEDSLENRTYSLYNPYKRVSPIGQKYYIITRVENVMPMTKHFQSDLQTSLKYKELGNQLYKEYYFYHALLCYEKSLAMVNDPQKKRQRAILYSNASACLYQIRLFQIALMYAEIAIRIDPTYPKAICRKFNSLLELSFYHNAPMCLLQLSSLIKAPEFEPYNNRYLSYLGNSSGIFNWLEIQKIKGPNPLNAMGEYSSEKIEIRIEGKRDTYYAFENIEKYELLLVNKALINTKHTEDQMKDAFPLFLAEVKKHSEMQKSFNKQFRSLPSSGHPEGMSSVEDDNCLLQSDFGLSNAQMSSQLEWCVKLERSFEQKSNTFAYGIYSKMFSFKQKCVSNCTYVHFKSALLVFAQRDIKKGERLTLDYMSEKFQSNNQDNKKQKTQKQENNCRCNYCLDFKNNFDSPKNKQFIQTQKHALSYTQKLLKEITWHKILKFIEMKQNFQKENYNNDLISYVETTQNDPSWEDICNLIRLARDCKGKQISITFFVKVIHFCFSKYFKLTGNNLEIFLKDVI